MRGRLKPRTNSALRSSLARFEREAILAALRLHEWNVTSAAQFLGLPRRTMYRRIGALRIQRPTGERA
ncbi:MAG: helix-turn-helix domain-containing protein [Vulcanimicrobiaceae bacterium]